MYDTVGQKGNQILESLSQILEDFACVYAVGDISLGCWKDSQQPASASGAAGNGLADSVGQPRCRDKGVPDEAQQASSAGGCGDMDLTNYFAMLPSEVVDFKDLVTPSPVSYLPLSIGLL